MSLFRRALHWLAAAIVVIFGFSLALVPAMRATATPAGDSAAIFTTAAFTRAAQQAEPAGARLSGLAVTVAADRSVAISGTLDGAAFVLRVPAAWNRDLVLFAHGYALPGTPADQARHDVIISANQVLDAPYAQGYAVAYSTFSKIGYAVGAGIHDTELLRRVVALIAPPVRTYILGKSMGGDVAMALVETYPKEYAGALPFCGVVGGWYQEVRYITDFRLIYDYFTRPLGPPIALPGAGHALATSADLSELVVANSVATLFSLAAKKPAYAAIVAQIARVSGANPDIITWVTALGAGVYGLADDLRTSGGNGYSNIGKVYLGSADDVALNNGIERIAAVPAATAYLERNYTPSGRFTARVLSLHNLIDPLVPYQQEAFLAAAVAAQHNGANLVQQIVDSNPVNTASPLLGGPTHCYFSRTQLTFAWNELRHWVVDGVRPVEGRNITKGA